MRPLPSPRPSGLAAEALFTSIGADIWLGGNRACYVPSLDQIRMPLFEAFRDPVPYYATRAHEATPLAGT